MSVAEGLRVTSPRFYIGCSLWPADRWIARRLPLRESACHAGYLRESRVEQEVTSLGTAVA
jgi:hypothetical protein